MELTAVTSIKFAGRWYRPGQQLVIADVSEAERLINMKAATYRVPHQVNQNSRKPVTIQPVQPVIRETVESVVEDKTEYINPVIPVITENTAIINIDTDNDIDPEYTLDGIGNDVVKILCKHGYDTVEKLQSATLTELVAIPKIGYSKANKILKAMNG